MPRLSIAVHALCHDAVLQCTGSRLSQILSRTWQVQLSMLAVALLSTFPLLCSAEHLAHAPFANAIRAFVGAADEFSGAVLPMSSGQPSARQQCRQLHILVYVRTLCRAPFCELLSKAVCIASQALWLCAHKHGVARGCPPSYSILRLLA